MKDQLPNMLCAAGIILVTVGIVQIWQPLAWLFGGVLLCVCGVLLHRKESNRTE